MNIHVVVDNTLTTKLAAAGLYMTSKKFLEELDVNITLSYVDLVKSDEIPVAEGEDSFLILARVGLDVSGIGEALGVQNRKGVIHQRALSTLSVPWPNDVNEEIPGQQILCMTKRYHHGARPLLETYVRYMRTGDYMLDGLRAETTYALEAYRQESIPQLRHLADKYATPYECPPTVIPDLIAIINSDLLENPPALDRWVRHNTYYESGFNDISRSQSVVDHLRRELGGLINNGLRVGDKLIIHGSIANAYYWLSHGVAHYAKALNKLELWVSDIVVLETNHTTNEHAYLNIDRFRSHLGEPYRFTTDSLDELYKNILENTKQEMIPYAGLQRKTRELPLELTGN